MANKGINKVILIGNLGQNPEIRYAPNGNAITNIVIATTDMWKDKQTGENKEKTEWHRIVLFGKLAEIAGEYLKKGSQVYIEGSLQTRKWTDQNGIDRYITEVIVNITGAMQMLGNNKNRQDKKNEELLIDKNNKKNIFLNKNNTDNNKKSSDPLIDFDEDIPF